MDRALSILKALALVVFIALGTKVYFLIDHADKGGAVVLGEIQHELDGNRKDSFMHITKKTVGETRDLIGHTSTLVADEGKRAEGQNKAFLAAVGSVTTLAGDTNKNLNAPVTGVIPVMAKSLQDSTAGLTKVTDATAITIQDIDRGIAPVLVSTLASSRNLEGITGDPAIRDSFKKLSFDLGEVGGMAADGHAITTDVRAKVNGILHHKPLTFWQKTGEFTLSHLSQLSQIKLGWF